MRKIIFQIFYFSVIILLYSPAYSSVENHIRIEAIDTPLRIVMQGYRKNERTDFQFKIYFRYIGDDIVTNNKFVPIVNGMSLSPSTSYSFFSEYTVKGKILFYDKNGNTIDRIIDNSNDVNDIVFKGYALSGGINHFQAFFQNEKLYSKSFKFFLLDEINDVELEKAIKKKELSKILIVINNLTISWNLESENKRIRKEKLYLKVNTKLNISVIYREKKFYRNVVTGVGQYAKKIIKKMNFLWLIEILEKRIPHNMSPVFHFYYLYYQLINKKTRMP